MLGMLLSLPQILGSNITAHFVLGFTAMTSSLMFFVLFFVPESPRHLLLKIKNVDRGRHALDFYLGSKEKAGTVFQSITSTANPKQSLEFKKFWKSVPKKVMI